MEIPTPAGAPTPPPTSSKHRTQPKAQLTKGMEHIHSIVAIESPDESLPEHPETYGVPGSIQPLRRPKTDSSNNPQKRNDPFQFGSRFLEEGDDIFAYNAWDHVETDESYNAFAKEQIARQKADPVSDFDKARYNAHPERFWNKFYSNNTSNFFKNRKWLQQEFPVLTEVTQNTAPPTTILEVGAGAGNTAFPIMATNKNRNLTLHACDFSAKAVEVIRSNPAYGSHETIGTIHASVWDVASPPNEANQTLLPEGVAPESVDVVILIFIFSALAPSQWDQAIRNVWRTLKPGGLVLFRDYGRNDLAMVRFKKGRYLDENFYVRGDGTRVYFFDEDELKTLWGGVRAEKEDFTGSSGEEKDQLSEKLESLSIEGVRIPRFEIVKFGVDRRMLVNRQRKLKMYRCWMQACFRKPITPS